MAGALAAVVLAAIGILHVVWGFSPWPAPSHRSLARYVWGRGGMPSRAACLTVGIGLAIAAYGVLAVLGDLPDLGPHWLHVAGIWALASVLLLRGLAGPLLNLGAGREFARWNLIAYSPLCAALGLCVLTVTGNIT